MKIFHRYIVGSLLRIIGISVVLVALLLVVFDVFSHIEQYMNQEVSFSVMGMLTVLHIPAAIGLALGPSSLFAVTYFLAMLHANNEMIILSNIGYPFRKIITPIISIGLLLVVFQFFFSEFIIIPATREKSIQTQEALKMHQSTDSRNITLQSPDGDYILHAGRYYDNAERIVDVTLVLLNDQHQLSARIYAASGQFNGSYWVLYDTQEFYVQNKGTIQSTREKEYHNPEISIEPTLFRNLSADISSMELSQAVAYVKRVRMIDTNQYIPYATDLADRIFSNITPLILILISCSTVFTWRKNVLILSIIASLAISVVYFVMNMLSMILARQGIIVPILGPLAPMLVLLLISSSSILIRRM